MEENSDRWFENPCGWILGPGEKRSAEVSGKAQDSGRGSITKMFSKATTPTNYKRRWFVLDTTQRTLKYYKDEKSRIEEGCIDMTTVIDVQACTDPNGPTYAFDLVGRGGRCSLGGSTYKEVIRWCYALQETIQTILPVAKSDLAAITSAEGVAARNTPREDDDKRWYRYSHTFPEQGPLMLNVVGLTDQDASGNVQSHWLLVTSFARFQDGKLGPAEKSNKIKIKDYIVGVNDVDLTSLPYHDAMAGMRKATFPKTVHFLRDLLIKQEAVYIEGWVYANYAALNRRRKRYIELDSDNINFRKPTLGGATSVKKESYFAIEQISYIRPMLDNNFPEDSRHVLKLICNNASVVHFVGNDGMTVGTTAIDSLDLYFPTREEMDKWVQFLSTSSMRPRKLGGVSVGDLHVTPFEEIAKSSNDGNECIDVLGIRSYVSGTFAPREFSITEDGFLYWKRPSRINAERNIFKDDRGRRLFIADSRTCTLKALYAAEDQNGDPNYPFQILIQDIHQMVWFGMPDIETCMKWIDLLKGVIERAPEASRSNLTIPTEVLPLSLILEIMAENPIEDDPAAEGDGRNRASSMFGMFQSQSTSTATTADTGNTRKSFFSMFSRSSASDEDTRNRSGSLFARASMGTRMSFLGMGGSVALEDDPNPEIVSGYLYYKHKSKVKKPFSKFWFSLKGYKLYYYKEKVKATTPGEPNTNKPLGFVDLLEVLEVREALEAGAPENALELVTPVRPYMLTAMDEDQSFRWLDALSETLEMRATQVKEEAKVNKDGISNAEKISDLKKAIVFESGLSKKSVNKITMMCSWKEQYFVIWKSSVLMFEKKSDVFLNEKFKEQISIPAIRLIESSEDASCNPGCAFDVHAYVTKGGNKEGMRIFTFEAQTANLCKEWMNQLCAATGSLVMQPRANGDGFASVVNSQLRQKKENFIKNNGAKFVKMQKANSDYEYDESTAFKKPFASFKKSEKPTVLETQKTEFFNNSARRGLAGRGGVVRQGSSQRGGLGISGRSDESPMPSSRMGEDEDDIPEAQVEDVIPEALPSREFV